MTGRRAAAIAVLMGVALTIGLTACSGSAPTIGVAYVTGAANSPSFVWLARPNGSHARRLGRGSRPLLAPNGSLVAATRGSGLVLYPTADGSPHRYFDRSGVIATATAFSPNSRYLAVVLSSTNPTSAAGSALAVIDTTTFGYRIIVRRQIYGASFAPDGSDRIAYASAATPGLGAPVDVHLIGPDGSRPQQITHDGRSLNPVWGQRGIAFDRERLRVNAEPAYHVWMMARDGRSLRPLTGLRIPALRDGLVPLGFSADGGRLLAEYVGLDTSEAWLLTLSEGRIVRLGTDLTGTALSRNGARALVDRGGFLNAPGQGIVESLPLGGGPPRVLAAHGSNPSWNV
jgi:hypothetical protein